MIIEDIPKAEETNCNRLVTNPYVKEQIDEFIRKEKAEHPNLQPAIMDGVVGDLQRLKPIIERLYDENIFYMSYWEDECPFHGWKWSKDDGTMSSMAYICDEITKKFEEIYGLIRIGLEEDKGENNENNS